MAVGWGPLGSPTGKQNIAEDVADRVGMNCPRKTWTDLWILVGSEISPQRLSGVR